MSYYSVGGELKGIERIYSDSDSAKVLVEVGNIEGCSLLNILMVSNQ